VGCHKRRCQAPRDNLDSTISRVEKECLPPSCACREDGTTPCRTDGVSRTVVGLGRRRTHVVVARDHWSVADIVTDAVLGLVGVDVVFPLDLLFGLLFLLVLAALGALDIRNCLLAVLGSSDFTLRWRLPARACACRCRWWCGCCERRRRLAKDTVTTGFTSLSSTFFVWLGLFALSFRRWYVTACRPRTQRGWRRCLRYRLRSWCRCLRGFPRLSWSHGRARRFWGNRLASWP
jgi:hypothetical protein